MHKNDVEVHTEKKIPLWRTNQNLINSAKFCKPLLISVEPVIQIYKWNSKTMCISFVLQFC